tara:strand:+ start:1274 stop:1579 length:306 start_codon:yes stop_codon:yes gene_type:complete
MVQREMRPIIVAIVLTIASACAPQDYLREDYIGKRFLQPDRYPHKIQRDAQGNAIIETERPTSLLSNLPMFSLPRISFPKIDLPDIDLPDLWPFGNDDDGQ